MDIDYCDHCGHPLSGGGDHSRCRHARQLEPPRYCGRCGRRMTVQVTPHGWTGRCAAHGLISAAAPGASGRSAEAAARNLNGPAETPAPDPTGA